MISFFVNSTLTESWASRSTYASEISAGCSPRRRLSLAVEDTSTSEVQAPQEVLNKPGNIYIRMQSFNSLMTPRDSQSCRKSFASQLPGEVSPMTRGASQSTWVSSSVPHFFTRVDVTGTNGEVVTHQLGQVTEKRESLPPFETEVRNVSSRTYEIEMEPCPSRIVSNREVFSQEPRPSHGGVIMGVHRPQKDYTPKPSDQKSDFGQSITSPSSMSSHIYSRRTSAAGTPSITSPPFLAGSLSAASAPMVTEVPMVYSTGGSYGARHPRSSRKR